MTFAVFQTGGKQIIAEEGETITIEKLPDEKQVVFNEVLLIGDKNGNITVGKPFIANAAVHGEVIEHGRHKKITVRRYHPKTRHRRKKGHKQHYTKVKITRIAKTRAKSKTK